MAAAPRELVNLLQAADADAHDQTWACFITRFSPLLLNTARSMVRDHDRAMDAYGHLLQRLHDDRRLLTGYAAARGCQFTTWLVTVARHLCVDHLRQRYGRHRGQQPKDRETRSLRRRVADLVADEISHAGPVPDPNTGAEAHVRRRDLASALKASLAYLSPSDRLLLTMRFDDNRPAREIASLLHYPTTFHVYRALKRIFHQLRHSLALRGVTDSEP